MSADIVVLPGDGIGPEITAEAVRALELVATKGGHDFRFSEHLIGGAAIDATGGETSLPDETLEAAKTSRGVLLGAVGGPAWDMAPVRPEQGLLKIRKEMDLFANLRPVMAFDELIGASPLKEELIKGVDFLFVRELVGGIYFGPREEATDEKRCVTPPPPPPPV